MVACGYAVSRIISWLNFQETLPMLKLCGFAASNYYKMVKLALLS